MPARPPFWIGHRVVPELVDIWVEDDGYVHDGFRYARTCSHYSRNNAASRSMPASISDSATMLYDSRTFVVPRPSG
jgi:hypothetical protein